MYNSNHLTYLINNAVHQLNTSFNDNIIDELVSLCNHIIYNIKCKYLSSSESSIFREGCVYRNDLIKECILSTPSDELQDILYNDSDMRFKKMLERLFTGLIKPIFHIEPEIDIKYISINDKNIIKTNVKIDLRV